jgi:predicted nucleic acid-binding protein
MRRYLLDTTPLAGYLNGRQAFVARIEPWITVHEAATSILVYGEVAEYLQGFPDFANRQRALRELAEDVYPYFITYAIAERYARIRRQLRAPYGPGLIGDLDTLIAATALENDLTLVTCDEDFSRVSDLRVVLLPRRS